MKLLSGKKPFVLLILFFLAAACFYPVLTGKYLLTERDLSVFFIPPRILWVEALKNGEFPLWNPYSYIGHPLFATLQPGVLYPLNLLLLVLPFDIAFNWLVVIHFALSGFFIYTLLREIEVSHTGSLLSALCFMLSGYLFSVYNLLSTLFSVTWVPLAIYFFLRTIKKSSFPYAALTGLALAVMFLGGGIEVVFSTMVLLACTAFFPGIFQVFVQENGTSKKLFLFSFTVIVFILLSSIELWPFLELANHSTRAGGLSYNEATVWSMDLKDIVQFFIPDPYGYFTSEEKYWANQSWLKDIYTGTIPFILASFFLIEKKARALPLVLAGLLAFALAMGKNALLYPYLFTYFPFFNKIRYPVKFLFLTFLFISLACGMGFDSLKQGIEAGRSTVRKGVFMLLALATLAALALGTLSLFHAKAAMFFASSRDYAEINIFNTKRLLVFFILAVIIIYSSFSSMKLRRLFPYAMLLLLTVDLFFAHTNYYVTTKSTDYHSPGEVINFIKEDSSLFRVFTTPRTKKEKVEGVAPQDIDKSRLTGYNIEHRIFDIDGMDVMRRGDYAALYTILATQRRIDSTNILPMLNVKYVISVPEITSDEFRLVRTVGLKNKGEPKEGLLKIYENKNFLPRFYMVNRFSVVTNPNQYLTTLSSKNFSPSTEVLLEEAPSISYATLSKGPERLIQSSSAETETAGTRLNGSIQVSSYRNHSIELMVHADKPGMLVASEAYFPGWKAYVDGIEKKILKADYVLMAITIDKGEHSVRLVYEPWTFRLGGYLSLFTLVVLASGGVFILRRILSEQGRNA